MNIKKLLISFGLAVGILGILAFSLIIKELPPIVQAGCAAVFVILALTGIIYAIITEEPKDDYLPPRGARKW